MTTEPTTSASNGDIDFAALSDLPEVDQAARTPHRSRPRFEGDVSELPDRACWALQHLLTRRYISAETDRDLYSWVLEYRPQLTVRLSELDLMLRVIDGLFDDGGWPSSNRPVTNRRAGSNCCAANRWAPTTRFWRCT